MELFGVPKHIVSFVLLLGYSFTLHAVPGAGVDVRRAGRRRSRGVRHATRLTLMLTSKGVAGVPRASLVILAGTLATFNLPIEGIAVILGVDTLMDMCRTSVNLLGNCLATAVVGRWEGFQYPTEPATRTDTLDIVDILVEPEG
jgi:proton glutamate symport protein